MTDKELIKEEIERLKHTSNAYDRSRFMLLLEIEKFIDSLPEVSTDEANYTPKSNDLEKAAVEAFKKIVDSGNNSFLEIFKAGVEWQKDKMNLLLQTEYEKGLFDLNKAMMKDAVELHIVESFNPVGTENEKPHGFTALCYNAKYPDFYPITGQTIKVIPFKEIQKNEQDCRKKGIGSISIS